MNHLTPSDAYPSWISELETHIFSNPWPPLSAQEILFIEAPWAYARWSLNVIAKEAELLRVQTNPSQQRKGKAKQLLLSSERYFMDLEIEHLLLEVRESNTAALKLYQNLGWSFFHERIAYYPDGENAHLYEKWL